MVTTNSTVSNARPSVMPTRYYACLLNNVCVILTALVLVAGSQSPSIVVLLLTTLVVQIEQLLCCTINVVLCVCVLSVTFELNAVAEVAGLCICFLVFRVWSFWRFLTYWRYICFVLTLTTARFAGSSLTIGLCLFLLYSRVLWTGCSLSIWRSWNEKEVREILSNVKKVTEITGMSGNSLFWKK